jgi:hypothetical protein
MPDPTHDKRAEMLRSGAARRPTATPGEDARGEAEPTEERRAPRRKARTDAGDLDRFAYPKVLCRWARRLTRTQLAVALALWNRQPRQRDRAFPVGHRTLGDDCGGIARNHVSEATERLEALGLVRVVKRGDKRTQETNWYLVPEHPPEPPADAT